MKWVLFTGTWRQTNEEVERDVRNAVREVLSRGDGIVTGGATGVDYFAMDEVMKLFPDASRLIVVIPAYFDDYLRDYYTNWCHTPITEKDIDALAGLLKQIRTVQPESIIELPFTDITQEHYDMRHDEEVKRSHEVYAFQVNNSTGTQNTIDKALDAGLLVTLHKKYTIV